MEKYFVETWTEGKEIACFNTAEDREDWLVKNCHEELCGGWFLNSATQERVAYYED